MFKLKEVQGKDFIEIIMSKGFPPDTLLQNVGINTLIYAFRDYEESLFSLEIGNDGHFIFGCETTREVLREGVYSSKSLNEKGVRFIEIVKMLLDWNVGFRRVNINGEIG